MQLAILNIANPGGGSLPELPALLLKGLEALQRSHDGAQVSGRRRVRAGAQNARHGHESKSITDGFLDSREFARMTRAIEFIEREYQRQPKLAQIARFVGLSEFHFNRLFRRWTGLTPKQYLAEVTSRAAGTALRTEPSVLDAAHSVGLSGGGRLHDLTVTLDAMTPGEIRARRRGRHHSSWRRRYAVRIRLSRGNAAWLVPTGIHRRCFRRTTELAALRDSWPKARFVRDDARAATLIDTIWGHKSATLPLAVCGTNFQVQVWRALLELEPGETVTYSALARQLGSTEWRSSRW